jgi:hypothetical protein
MAFGKISAAAMAFGKISAAADQLFRDVFVGDFDTPAEHFSEFCDPSHVWPDRRKVQAAAAGRLGRGGPAGTARQPGQPGAGPSCWHGAAGQRQRSGRACARRQ